MGKKYKRLFCQIVTEDALYAAYRRAANGRRNSVSHLMFREHLARNLEQIRFALISGDYRPGQPREFMVHEPKPRLITAMPFEDRVVQHALCGVIEPLFDRVFLPNSFACRKGMGTHRAAVKVQSMIRRSVRDGEAPWILKTDFSRYFASVDRAILHREFRMKIACEKTMALLGLFVPGHGTGLPIGNLTSQLSANVYGHMFDRWLAHQVGIQSFVRYMDDVVIIGRSREAMALLQVQAQMFAERHMGLRFSRWSIQPWRCGVNFCGYRIWPDHKLLRRDSVIRARRKLRRLGGQDRQRFLASWIGHARHADTKNLLYKLGVNTHE